MKKILLLSSLFISFNSFSADVTFNWLKSTSGQNSALSGTCDFSDESNDMVCNLRQIRVSKKLSPEDAEKDIKAATLELDTDLKDKSIKEYVDEKLGSVCKKIPLSETDIQSLGSDREAYDAIVDICKSPSRNKVLALVTSSAKNDLKTCKVMDYDTGNFQFNQVSDRKWVSTNEPSGQCGAVTILSLEQHPKHDSLWNYSQIRHYTNTESELCKSLSEINEPMSYSWNGNKSLKMECEFIEFGM
ncbi:MAG: hypothetical protein ACI92O_001588 [Colwellia sp.]|jgi:hypothetical protein|tara:strand:- start:11190 stop:11924 length:735 start_codon:yes stop_codon:yes gene_type:complete